MFFPPTATSRMRTRPKETPPRAPPGNDLCTQFLFQPSHEGRAWDMSQFFGFNLLKPPPVRTPSLTNFIRRDVCQQTPYVKARLRIPREDTGKISTRVQHQKRISDNRTRIVQDKSNGRRIDTSSSHVGTQQRRRIALLLLIPNRPGRTEVPTGGRLQARLKIGTNRRRQIQHSPPRTIKEEAPFNVQRKSMFIRKDVGHIEIPRTGKYWFQEIWRESMSSGFGFWENKESVVACGNAPFYIEEITKAKKLILRRQVTLTRPLPTASQIMPRNGNRSIRLFQVHARRK